MVYKPNFDVTLERKNEPLPRFQFTVPFYAESEASIRSTLSFPPNLFDVVRVVSI